MQLAKVFAIICSVVLCTSCAGQSKPKFVDVASLLCERLDDFIPIRDSIVTIHALIGQGDYAAALKAARTLAESIDELKDVEGYKEVRALIILLESIVKGLQ
jgi:hypothetical protein